MTAQPGPTTERPITPLTTEPRFRSGQRFRHQRHPLMARIHFLDMRRTDGGTWLPVYSIDVWSNDRAHQWTSTEWCGDIDDDDHEFWDEWTVIGS